MTNYDLKEIRRHGIGGSDTATVLGINPYKTAYELYLEKVEGISTDLSNNEAIVIGRLLEDEIAKKYELVTKEKLSCSDYFIHPDYPYIIGKPDRIIQDSQKIIEIKTTNDRFINTSGAPLPDELMECYALQVHHYMLVTGYKKAELVVSVVSGKIRTQILCALGNHIVDNAPLDLSKMMEECVLHRYNFEHDQEIEDIIVAGCKNFWEEHVEKRVPPPIDYTHKNARECLRKKYDKVYEQSVQLDDAYIQLKNEYLAYKAEISVLEKKANEAQAKILDAMMNFSVGKFGDGSVCIRKLIKTKGYTIPDREYIRVDFKDMKKGDSNVNA